MAKVKDAKLFSAHFGIRSDILSKAGLIDPFINVDTQLFIDPVLLTKSANPIISTEGTAAFRDHFSNFVRLLSISKATGDAAWRAAQRLLDRKREAVAVQRG